MSLCGQQLFDLGAQLGITRLGEVSAVGERDHGDVGAPADSARDIRRLNVDLEVDVVVVDAHAVEQLLGPSAVSASFGAVCVTGML
jgi:hypothetical protein